MKFETFVRLTTDYFDSLFKELNSTIPLDKRSSATFPRILLCTQTRHHYIAELFGRGFGLTKLSVKRSRSGSLDRYINQFAHGDDLACVYSMEESFGSGFDNCVVSTAEQEAVETRFPFLDLENATVFMPAHDDRAYRAIKFGPKHRSSYFRDCAILNAFGNHVRLRMIQHLVAINKNLWPARLNELLSHMRKINVLPYVVVAEAGDLHRRSLAGQFVSLYLTEGLHETTIGHFLDKHPDILKTMLNADEYLYEPYFPWLVEHPVRQGATAINPDLLVKRSDGLYDIYDLKTAVLQRASLVKGIPSRRRFIDYVYDGIAQLNHYSTFFEIEEHREMAFKKFGATIDNPKLNLVVGHFENAPVEEIREASRAFNNISVIDYSTLMMMLAHR